MDYSLRHQKQVNELISCKDDYNIIKVPSMIINDILNKKYIINDSLEEIFYQLLDSGISQAIIYHQLINNNIVIYINSNDSINDGYILDYSNTRDSFKQRAYSDPAPYSCYYDSIQEY